MATSEHTGGNSTNAPTQPPEDDSFYIVAMVSVVFMLVFVVTFGLLVTKRRRRLQNKSKVYAMKDINLEELDIKYDQQLGVSSTNFAMVYRGTFCNRPVVIKELPFNSEVISSERCSEIQEAIQSRINLSHHPNLILIIMAGFSNLKLLYLIEYCERGSLFDVIHHGHVVMSLPLRLKMVLDITQGVSMMHSNMMLAPRLTSKSVYVTNDWVAKVRIPEPELDAVARDMADWKHQKRNDKAKSLGRTDFSRDNNSNNGPISNTGSLIFQNRQAHADVQWISPEAISGDRCSTASDVYCIGTILYEAITQEEPFANENIAQVVQDVVVGKRPVEGKRKSPKRGKTFYASICSQTNEYVEALKLLNLVETCWKQNPEERCSIVDLERTIHGILENHEISLPPEVPKLRVKQERDENGIKALQENIKQPWEVQYDDIQIGELIGTGACGSVYRGKWHGTVVAIKTLPVLNDCDEQNDEATVQPLVDEFVHEISLICDLRHPHILSFYGACTRVEHLCMVLEYAPLGSLDDLIQHNERQISWETASSIVRCAASGLLYLHSLDVPIIHRNFQCRNLLLFNSSEAKISDFGLSIFSKTKNKQSKAIIGNRAYMSPEMLRCDKIEKETDSYSFGCVLYALAAGDEPFGCLKLAPQQFYEKVVDRHLRPKLPTDGSWPDSFVKLVQDCWSTKVHNRPDFHDILSCVSQLQAEVTSKYFATKIQPLGDVMLNSFERDRTITMTKATSK